MSIYPKGFSFYFSWGDNQGLKILQDGPSYRLHLWKLSFCIAHIDIEKILGNLVDELKVNDAEKNEIKKLKERLELDRKVIDSQREKYKEQQEEIEREREDFERFKEEIESGKNEEGEKIGELKRDIDELKTKIEVLEEEKEDLNNEITDLNDYSGENETLKNKITELKNKIKEINGKIEVNIVIVGNLEKEIEELNIDKNGLEELHDKLVEEIYRLEEENIDLLEEDDINEDYDLLESSTSSESSY